VSADLEAVWPAVGEVAGRHQHRLAARPVIARVDQFGVAGDIEPRGIIAVKVADRDDSRGRLLGGGWRRCTQPQQQGDHHQREPDH